MSEEEFFEKHFEKAPFCLKREDSDYFKNLFCRADIERHLEQQNGPSIKYGETLNLAKCENGKKVMKNVKPDGSIVALDEVRASLDKLGVSVQLQQPQRFSEPVWMLMAELEKKFGALFGANAYLTPEHESGFAPHFDDVEVWMLQLEGRKRWRCWTPNEGVDMFFKPDSTVASTSTPAASTLPPDESTFSIFSKRHFRWIDGGDSSDEEALDNFELDPTAREKKERLTKLKEKKLSPGKLDRQDYSTSLPNAYSRDFSLEECEKNMTLRLDVVLEPGDVLYLPRGTVHYGEALEETAKDSKRTPSFSHHLTVSTYQKHTFGDVIAELLPTLLKKAVEKDVRFRYGLPPRAFEQVGCLQHGSAQPRNCKKIRDDTMRDGTFEPAFQCKQLVSVLADLVTPKMVNSLFDQIASDFFVQRLPPYRVCDRGPAPPTLKSEVRIADVSLLRCALDIDPETCEAQCLLFYPLRNVRSLHMAGDAKLEEFLQQVGVSICPRGRLYYVVCHCT